MNLNFESKARDLMNKIVGESTAKLYSSEPIAQALRSVHDEAREKWHKAGWDDGIEAAAKESDSFKGSHCESYKYPCTTYESISEAIRSIKSHSGEKKS